MRARRTPRNLVPWEDGSVSTATQTHGPRLTAVLRERETVKPLELCFDLKLT
jgi:hypothetical protein